MEDLKNTTVRQAYLQALADDKKFDIYKKKSLLSPNQPLFEPHYINDEEEISYDNVNQNVLETSFDILNLSMNVIDNVSEIENLMYDVDERIKSIDEKIQAEEERVKDVNMICGNITDFNTIIPLTVNNFSIKSTLYQYRNCITASQVNEKKATLRLININGNGFVGNDYIVSKQSDLVMQKDLMDTSNESYMYDTIGNLFWEYSRLFSYDSVNKSDIVNIDDLPVQVQLTFQSISNDGVNEIVFSDTSEVHITAIEISDDNVNWHTTFEGDIVPNKQDNSYSDFTYIYGTGALVFPTTQFVRLSMYSHKIDDNKIKVNNTINPNIYRKVIRITSVEGRRTEFNNGTGLTPNLIESGRAIAVGIFCNEYVPDFIRNNLRNEVTYTLIINGKQYNVVPINSNRRGIKFIKYSKTSLKENYVEYINEPISSIQIGLTIPTTYNYSPYLANFKLCLGKQVSNV